MTSTVRPVTFFFSKNFRKIWRHDAKEMLIRTVDSFSMSLSPSASDSPETLEVKFQVPVQRPNHLGSSPSCREILTVSSHFLWSRIDQRVSSKNGGTSTGETRCRGKFDDLHWQTPTRRFKEFSSAAWQVYTRFKCAERLERCVPTIILFCTVSFVVVAGFVYSR